MDVDKIAKKLAFDEEEEVISFWVRAGWTA